MIENFHYYCFTFEGKTISSNEAGISSVYWGLKNKNITYPNMMEAKQLADMNSEAVLLGISYFGYMTAQEFKPDRFDNEA